MTKEQTQTEELLNKDAAQHVAPEVKGLNTAELLILDTTYDLTKAKLFGKEPDADALRRALRPALVNFDQNFGKSHMKPDGSGYDNPTDGRQGIADDRYDRLKGQAEDAVLAMPTAKISKEHLVMICRERSSSSTLADTILPTEFIEPTSRATIEWLEFRARMKISQGLKVLRELNIPVPTNAGITTSDVDEIIHARFLDSSDDRTSTGKSEVEDMGQNVTAGSEEYHDQDPAYLNLMSADFDGTYYIDGTDIERAEEAQAIVAAYWTIWTPEEQQELIIGTNTNAKEFAESRSKNGASWSI